MYTTYDIHYFCLFQIIFKNYCDFYDAEIGD